MSTGGFIRLFHPQCSDIRTVIYLRIQVFHPSWTSEMRVCRTRYIAMGHSYASCQWLSPFPQRPVLMSQNEKKISTHILQEPVVCCNECTYVMCVCGINGEKATFWCNWCEKPSTVPHTSWNFYLPFYQLSGWFWNNKFAIPFMHLHLSLLYTQHKTLL